MFQQPVNIGAYLPLTRSDASQARQLPFDSIIRDISNGLGMFLQRAAVQDAPDTKFDKYVSDESVLRNMTKLGNLKAWTGNPEGIAALLYPPPHDSEQSWQVQYWFLRGRDLLHANSVVKLLNGQLLGESPLLREIDFAFMSYGLHDQRAWKHTPYGPNYFNIEVKDYLELRRKVKAPLVWASMNEHCVPHDPLKTTTPGAFAVQGLAVQEANAYTKHRLEEAGIPYYDAAAPLRTPQICDISSDGVHVKMWVDLVRAQILLNHLCDENNHWIGSTETFVSRITK